MAVLRWSDLPGKLLVLEFTMCDLPERGVVHALSKGHGIIATPIIIYHQMTKTLQIHNTIPKHSENIMCIMHSEDQ